MQKRISFVWKKLLPFFLLIPFSEIFVRFILGIGNPILFKSHPTIEYIQLPSQKLHVFHNKITINSLGMRSDELVFPKRKNTKRILVYGDSVIFGGNLLSDENLATTLLKTKLNLNNFDYEIANISSGSWGPGNWLSYINEMGLFNADHVLIILNSKDFFDVPKYESIINNPLYPSKKPLFATTFFIKRYLLPKLNFAYQKISKYIFTSTYNENFLLKENNIISNGRKNSLEDLKKIIYLIKRNGIGISVIQFWDRDEFKNNKPRNTNLLIRDVLENNNINILQSVDYFKQCSFNPNDLYIDNIHPFTSLGQECLSNIMKKSLESNKTLEINK